MITIIQFNCRSYNANKDIIAHLIQSHNPDILILNSTCTDMKIKHFGYTSRQSPYEQYEGVAILVKSNIKHEFKTDHTFQHFLSVKIHTQHGPMIICTAYSRPNTHIPFTDLNNIFNNTHIPVYILADLNARHPTFQHHDSNTHGQQLHTITTNKNLHHIGPHFPTFYGTQGTGNPDTVITNTLGLQYQHYISPGPHSGSDHIPITLHLSENPLLIPTPTPTYQYTQADWQSFKTTLAEQEYTLDLEHQHTGSIDNTWTQLFNIITSAANTHIPKHTHKQRYSFKPSLRTQRLLQCYRRRFEQNKHNIAPTLRDLCYLRTHIIHSLLHDHRKHWASLVEAAQEHRTHNPREFWQRIAKLRGTAAPPFDFLKVNGREIREPAEVAQTLKQHWETVFHPHPPAQHRFVTEHINNITRETQRLRHRTTPDQIIDTSTLDPDHILTTPYTTDEVKHALKTTKKKAPGDSQIGHQILHNIPDQTIQAITYLFNTQLATGYFPTHFKAATAVMIPKPNKNHTDPQNYRPISLLEVLGKTFEKLYNWRLRQHLEDEELLSDKQFGFRANKSTQTALNITANYLHMNKKHYKTALLTKDVQKAFDTVWHTGLKYKICKYFHLPIKSQKLLSNFLDERRMRIRFKNTHSDYFTLYAGVPQGSVLSPTLYIMYTNDLPDPIYADSLTIQYADDVTQLVRHNNNPDTLTEKLNREITQVSDWELQWRINTNPTKAQITYFGTKRHFVPHRSFLNPHDPNPTPIPITLTNKVLGVTFDDKLTFRQHITMKRAIAGKALTSIQRFRTTATPKTKTHLYKALIRPLITYAPNILQLAAPTNRKKLQVIQNKSLHYIYNTHWSDFITNRALHEYSNIPPLNIYWRTLGDKQIHKLVETTPQWQDYFNNTILPGRYRRRQNNPSLLQVADTPLPHPVY